MPGSQCIRRQTITIIKHHMLSTPTGPGWNTVDPISLVITPQSLILVSQKLFWVICWFLSFLLCRQIVKSERNETSGCKQRILLTGTVRNVSEMSLSPNLLWKLRTIALYTFWAHQMWSWAVLINGNSPCLLNHWPYDPFPPGKNTSLAYLSFLIIL